MSRQNINDFMSAVRQQSVPGGNQYGASLNKDGTVLVTKNLATFHSRVGYNIQGRAAATDANQGSDDTVIIFSDSCATRVGGAQEFLNSLN